MIAYCDKHTNTVSTLSCCTFKLSYHLESVIKFGDGVFFFRFRVVYKYILNFSLKLLCVFEFPMTYAEILKFPRDAKISVS